MINRGIFKLTALLYGAFILWIIVRSNGGGCGAPCEPAAWLPMGDKIGHLGLLALLALVANLALPSGRGRFGLSVVSGCVLIAISMEECSQLFFPGRTPDVLDQLCNLCGVLIGDLISRLLERHMQPGQVTAEEAMNYSHEGV